MMGPGGAYGESGSNAGAYQDLTRVELRYRAVGVLRDIAATILAPAYVD